MKRLLFPLILINVFVVNIYGSNIHEQTDLLPFETTSGKYGYVDNSGKVVIDQKFDYADNFYGGLARVKVISNYGYIDKTGKMIIEPQFEDADNFSEGLAKIGVNNVCGYIDDKGKIVVKPQFQYAGNFSEGLARVKIDNKYGYINKTGKMIIEPQFEDADNFSEGLAKIRVNNACGYIDDKGKIVIKPQFQYADNFSEGLARVQIGGRDGYVDKTGKITIEPQFEGAGNFSEGLAKVRINKEYYGFIDNTGKVIINEPQFRMVANFSEGLARVEIDGKYGYIDKTGKVIIKPQFDHADNFFNGLAKVKKWDNNNLIYGIISRIGEVVIIDEKTEDVVIIKEAIKFSLNPGLSALLFFDKWEWCELYPAYEYNSVNHAHGPCYVFKEGTHMLFNTKYDNDFVGYKLKFGAQWGGKEEAKAKFRKGMVGHCKAIPVFITDGTEAKVNEKIYFFKNGKWQVKK